MPLPQAVAISNVAGDALQRQLAAVLPASPEPRWITSVRAQCGVRNSYADPAQLGCDRWAALIGARRLYTVLEKLLEEVSFGAGSQVSGESQKVLIDAAYVDARLADLAQDEDLARYVL